MKYRKKPVVIEAVHWDETKETFGILESMGMSAARYESHVTENFVRDLGICTLEGTMRAEKGDWIIKGVKGEFYPCKPDIFAATYELVEEISAECCCRTMVIDAREIDVPWCPVDGFNGPSAEKVERQRLSTGIARAGDPGGEEL